MDLDLSPEQKQLVDAFTALYDREADGARIHAADAAGYDPRLWDALVGNGVLQFAVSEKAGGWGASLLDLALVAEVHGAHAAAAPLVETLVVTALLGSIGAAGSETLDRVVAAGSPVTIALHPPRAGVATLVPYGAGAAGVVLLDGNRLLWVEPAGLQQVPTTASLAVADVPVPADATVLLEGRDAIDAYTGALDTWMVLTAASLVGVGSGALAHGVAYTTARHAFGRPIGSFQAIAHRLADSAVELEGARLLTYEAAWAVDADPGRAPELAAAAFATATEAARDASARALHFHGGYGFTLEYDIQLYFRRARALPLLLAAPETAFRWVSERRRARVREA